LTYCRRTIALRDGRIVYDGPTHALTASFLSELYGAESEELFLPARGDAGPGNGHANGVDGAEPIWRGSAIAAAPA